MSRAMNKFQVLFDSVGENIFRMVLMEREVRFQLIPNGLYYFNAADMENIVLLLNTVLENCKGFTQREYEGDRDLRRSMHLMGFP